MLVLIWRGVDFRGWFLDSVSMFGRGQSWQILWRWFLAFEAKCVWWGRIPMDMVEAYFAKDVFRGQYCWLILDDLTMADL